jgi:uncharacterized protein (DUF1778 family)
MPKTVTLRLDDDVYQLFKKAANGSKRTISNFLEFAALSYLTNEIYVSDEEMNDILQDKNLLKSLHLGEKEIAEGKYEIVG